MYLHWLTDDVLARLRAADKAPDGTVTMVFTDIVDSTAIKRLLGDTDAERDAAWVEAFQEPHHALVRACIDEHEGFEVKTIGDAFFITFTDPAKAVRCAVDIQRRMVEANLLTPLAGRPPLQIRVGMHTGTPILQGADYVGTSVDKAARVEGAAHGGQVLVSEQTCVLVKGQLSGLTFHPHGELLLKGLGAHGLFEVLWDGKAPAEPDAPRPPTETHKEPLTVEVLDDFPDEVFARDLETLRTATDPDPMRPQESKEAEKRVTEAWLAEFGKRLFARLFADKEIEQLVGDTDHLRLVVLESRLTASGGVDVSVAGAALSGGAPLVIAMQHPISVEAATEFVRTFYRRLTLGGDLPTALSRARRALQRRRDLSTWEWATPVLFWDGEASFPNPQSAIRNPTVVVTEPERANCIRALTLACGWGDLDSATPLYDRLSRLLTIRSYWSDDASSLRLMLVTAQRAPDADTPEGKQRIGSIFNNLGGVYQRQGRWSEAEACYQKSLEIRREFGDRVGEGTTLNNLGLLYEAQGDFAGALGFGRQAIAVLETTEDKAELERTRRRVAEWEKRV